MIVEILTNLLEAASRKSLAIAENSNKRAMATFHRAKARLDSSTRKLEIKRESVLTQLIRLNSLETSLNEAVGKTARQSAKIQEFIDA